MNCDCIQRVDDKLKEAGLNYQLAPSMVFDDKMQLEVLFSVPTRWIGEPPKGHKRKSPPTMICTYCPFCGKEAKGNKR
jgi:hypothetical protein